MGEMKMSSENNKLYWELPASWLCNQCANPFVGNNDRDDDDAEDDDDYDCYCDQQPLGCVINVQTP